MKAYRLESVGTKGDKKWSKYYLYVTATFKVWRERLDFVGFSR